MAYLLIPLCRGDQGGSSGRDDVGKGGLWWPEWTSEWARVALLSIVTVDAAAAAAPRRRWLSFWSWGETAGCDEVAGVDGWGVEPSDERERPACWCQERERRKKTRERR